MTAAAAGSPMTLARVGIVGRGRVGSTLAAALADAGYEVDGPAGRGEAPTGDAILLCVPDSEIEAACEVVAGRAALVGHTSGATPLSALDAATAHGAAVFGLHPLQTIAGGEAPIAGGDGRIAGGEAPIVGGDGRVAGGGAADAGGEAPIVGGDGRIAGDEAADTGKAADAGEAADTGGATPGRAAAALRGAGCAVAGSSPRAVAVANELALALGMTPFEIDDDQRAAYHAAASIASNYLLALEATAESVAAGAGIDAENARRLLGPLVRQTVENWLAHGPADALTGPVARGDDATVERQREAIRAVSPAALELFDALTERTRALTQVPA